MARGQDGSRETQCGHGCHSNLRSPFLTRPKGRMKRHSGHLLPRLVLPPTSKSYPKRGLVERNSCGACCGFWTPPEGGIKDGGGGERKWCIYLKLEDEWQKAKRADWQARSKLTCE